MRTWMVLLGLGLVFALLGLGMTLGGVLGDAIGVVGIGAVFLAVAVAMCACVPALRRQQAIGGELAPVAPGAAAPQESQPWPWSVLCAEVARELKDAPYVVTGDADRLRVVADLADARFATVLGVRRIDRTHVSELLRIEDGRTVLVDSQRQVEWSAGVDGSARPRLSASASLVSGRIWTRSVRKELGVSAQPKVEWDFSSEEVHRPLREVCERAGWRREWPVESKLGLALAIAGGSMVVVVPIALLVVWLRG